MQAYNKHARTPETGGGRQPQWKHDLSGFVLDTAYNPLASCSICKKFVDKNVKGHCNVNRIYWDSKLHGPHINTNSTPILAPLFPNLLKWTLLHMVWGVDWMMQYKMTWHTDTQGVGAGYLIIKTLQSGTYQASIATATSNYWTSLRSRCTCGTNRW